MRASELITELVMQIAQYGDMDINVMVDGAYHGKVEVSTSCKKDSEFNFMTVHGSGDCYGKMEGGGGEEGFYDDDDEKPSNEGFYLDENGVRQDAAFFAGDDDYVMDKETQLLMIKGCRDTGTPEPVIKSTYPDYYTPPNISK